jgi:hypothetical protein
LDSSCTIRCDFGAAEACPSAMSCASSGFCAATGVSCDPDGGVIVTDDAAITDDSVDAGTCYGTLPVQLCFTTAPTGAVNVASVATDACSGGSIMPVNGHDSCVIAGDTVTVETGAMTGSLPLVLVAASTLTVTGAVNASSTNGVVGGPAAQIGAGASSLACSASVDATLIFGGGAGGRFQGRGGAGLGTGGGQDVSTVGEIRPCRGGTGGANGVFAPGGLPGGVIHLIAGGSITITGSINASGAGGFGGPVNRGGGGGGSGGFIGVDAPSITIDPGAKLLAAGGGGGGGGDGGNAGMPGGNPTFGMPGLGGVGPMGGDGGNGSGFNGLDGSPGKQNLDPHGGGGGGGAGFITFFQAQTVCGGPSCVPASN